MRLGAFELQDPLPELRAPHALVVLGPWVDVGGVGTLAVSSLEERLGAQKLGGIHTPGEFFDFTRYRPVLTLKEGRRELSLPNAEISFARGPADNDLLFLHLLEPHAHGEAFVDSVLLLLTNFGVRRYLLIGGMYDMVPHTRQYPVTGSATSEKMWLDISAAGARQSEYQGPTTILYLVSSRAAEMGIEAASVIVHLPQYAQIEQDYAGSLRLAEVLASLYGFEVDPKEVERAEEQRKRVNAEVREDQELKSLVEHLETHYDSRGSATAHEPPAELSPEVERFLKEMDGRFKGD